VETLHASFWISSSRISSVSSPKCERSFSGPKLNDLNIVNSLIEYRPETQKMISHKMPQESHLNAKVLENQRLLVLERFLQERKQKIKDPTRQAAFEKSIRDYDASLPPQHTNYVIGQSERLSFSFRLAILSRLNEEQKQKSILSFLVKNVNSEQRQMLENYYNIVQMGLLNINASGGNFKFNVFKLISVELKAMLPKPFSPINGGRWIRQRNMGQIMIQPTLFIGSLKKGLAPKLYEGIKYEYFRDRSNEVLRTESGNELIFVDAHNFISKSGHSVLLLENALRSHYGHNQKKTTHEQMRDEYRAKLYLE
jgi:hypothetical protein